MLERSREIVYQSDEGQARIVIARSTAVIGMERSLMQFDGVQELKDEPRRAVRALRLVSYPDCIAPVVEASGEVRGVDFSAWPLSFADFCALPDDLIQRWEEAVYRLNPHWNPAGEPEAEQEKKAPS